LKKTFLRTELKRKILEPEEEPGETCIVPEMSPESIENAVVTVHEDGYAFVSWLQPVKDWRYWLILLVNGMLSWVLLYLVSLVVFGVLITLAAFKLQDLGMI
jgi:hypothetical protein